MSQINPYETQKILSDYLTSFYFDAENPLFSSSFSIDFLYPCDYLTTLSEYSLSCYKKYNSKSPSNASPLKALDIGCGVGRLAFELTVLFDEILAIDYSELFVKTCETLQKQGFYEYYRRKQGDISEKRIAKVPAHAKRERVAFKQGDAENLGAIGPFDLIVASNLIDRLKNPEKFLNSLPEKLTKEGVLVLTSPYSWLEDYSEKEKWIGGRDGKDSFSALCEIMKKMGFELCEQRTLKMIISDHERKFHMCLPHATVWRRA